MDLINYETIRRIKLLRPARNKKEKYHNSKYALCVSNSAKVNGENITCPQLHNGLCNYKNICNYHKHGKEETCYHLTQSY